MAKKQEQHDGEYWATFVKDKFDAIKDYRAPRIEKQWMINHSWLRGWHNLKYNTQTKRLTWDDTDPLRFYVNMVYTIVRAVRTHVTKNQPKWEVDGLPYGSMSLEDSLALGYYMESLFDRLNMKLHIKNAVTYGLEYGVGIFQYGYDENADRGEGNVWVETPDPFDVYIDHIAGSIKEARWVIKTMRKPLSELKKNPVYKNLEDLKADSKQSASEYKSMLMQKDSGVDEAMSSQDSVLLYEMWLMEDDGKVRVVTVPDGSREPIRNEKTDLTELPFVLYFPDINPGEIYGEGWVKNLVPLNRALNYLERSILEYNMMFSKGRYVMDSRANVKMITNENGQIIKKTRGSEFQQLDIKPMSATPFNQIQNLMRYIEDVGSAHEAFLGRTPVGVKAGVAIEQLISSNMNNLADLIDNLEMSLAELGEKLLKIGYDKFDTTKRFKVAKKGSERAYGAVYGRDAQPIPGAVALPEDVEVRVSIVSGIAHTKEALRETLMNLRANGDIDRRTLLEYLDVPDVDEVEARLTQERTGQPISEDAQNVPMPEMAPPMPEGMGMPPMGGMPGMM